MNKSYAINTGRCTLSQSSKMNRLADLDTRTNNVKSTYTFFLITILALFKYGWKLSVINIFMNFWHFRQISYNTLDK